MKRKILITAGAILFLTANAASAHSKLVASNPINGASVKALPQSIWLKFDENLMTIKGKVINRIQVNGPKGTYSEGDAVTTHEKLAINLKNSSDKGLYTITWRVVSEDGHPVTGSIKFKVI
jgi:methionine-rich copper-binding protein CopC